MNFYLVTFGSFIFIFLMTTLGSAFVFFVGNKINNKLYSIFLGLSSGIMTASAIWSLLLPSISMSEELFSLPFLPPFFGFILGAIFIVLTGVTINHSSKKNDKQLSNNFNRNLKLFIAITIHNIPEGLAVGFAFGSILGSNSTKILMSAIGLAVGIGLQNLPEGAAVSMPMLATSKRKFNSFMFGVTSGAVEPIFATLGFFLASSLIKIQPWLLAFSAGMMFFTVVDDIIPEAKKYSQHIGPFSFVLGFVLMMALDILL